jgi:RimJ/RimL family protein N-acetyltransferase
MTHGRLSDTPNPRRRREDLVLAAGELDLIPLTAADAAELAPVLDDQALHRYIGGEPLAPAQLEERYRRLEAGAPAGRGEEWLNWVIRRRDDGRAVGTAQATIRGDTALVAWVVATAWQGRGYAKAAARALVAALADARGLNVVANIHPDHAASERVAQAAGLTLTDRWADGERVWSTGR